MQDRWIADRVPSKVFPAYTRGNAGEVLPDPVSPLAWTLLWEGGIVRGCRDGFINFGLVDWDELETPDFPECFGMFGGYFYNPLALVRLMGARIPGGSPEAIDDALFSRRLSTGAYPDPDLLIRTGGELRVSNFLLWQIAYAEMYLTEAFWPDFRRRQLYEAIASYQQRDRRFGRVDL